MNPIVRTPAPQRGLGCLLPVLLTIVILLAAILGGMAWLIWGNSPQGVQDRLPWAAKTQPAKTPEDQEAKLVKEIIKSRWWKIKISEADVDTVVKAIVALNANEWLFIDNQGVVYGQEPGESHFTIREKVKLGIACEPGEIIIFLDGRKLSERLNRMEALALLERKIAAAEFRP